ncbi:hypothetical protein ELH42_37790 [Rhizobium ruizarguesonis]|uniref:hypothetical protein n=1 Tax=Rhizobium ruizarguesonis TaxID=2081791 RepID=UPI001030E97D|nr:hypothetical protein [Rhizobium ruizarguesonis]TBB57030.1 hypothetical protein ELH42_37790 [Rhizobium ruizarguesonis]
MADSVAFIVPVMLSLLVPIIVIAIRQTVKFHRAEVIRDLSAVFHSSKQPESERLVPSFEFVKFKYFVDGATERGERQDFPWWAWTVAVLTFFIVVSSISYICILFMEGGADATRLQRIFGVHQALPLCLTAVFAAFSGAYLNAIKAMSQSIQNFDLSPSLIVTIATQIFTGVVIAAIVAFALDALFREYLVRPSGSEPVGKAEFIAVLSFAIGWFPDAAERWLVGKSKLSNFKRENPSSYKLTFATPVEIIDGIDSDIRNRLADFHIVTTQNLATANPLMLFVETPFGVYQIMDWVAQAQLCASVGPTAVTGLGRIGVRTLFDLERAALDDRCRHPQLLQAIGIHLLGSQGDQSAFSAEAVVANIQMRLDDPHVHRLRQIYMQVGERIGERHWRFLARDGVGPQSYDAEGVVFENPNIIRISNNDIDLRPDDRLAVVGGKNNGKVLRIGGVDRTVITVDQDVVDEQVNGSADVVRLFRITP